MAGQPTRSKRMKFSMASYNIIYIQTSTNHTIDWETSLFL